jgi:hypothetical protein
MAVYDSAYYHRLFAAITGSNCQRFGLRCDADKARLEGTPESIIAQLSQTERSFDCYDLATPEIRAAALREIIEHDLAEVAFIIGVGPLDAQFISAAIDALIPNTLQWDWLQAGLSHELTLVAVPLERYYAGVIQMGPAPQ